jgi:hypothetical protein
MVCSEEICEPGIVAHTCNPSTWEAEMEDRESESILVYIARPVSFPSLTLEGPTFAPNSSATSVLIK